MYRVCLGQRRYGPVCSSGLKVGIHLYQPQLVDMLVDLLGPDQMTWTYVYRRT